MPPKSISITVKREVLLIDISNLLCSAFEQGAISYWAWMVQKIKPKRFDFRCDGDRIYPLLDFPLNPGGSIVLVDLETENKKYSVNLTSLKRGLQLMADKYPKHFNDLVTENADATTADVLIQLACLGELIYG